MAYGTQLQELVEMFKAETGRSTRANVGVDENDLIKTKLRRQQEFLYERHWWPHLRVVKSKLMQAGLRYYDAPTGLDLYRSTKVVVMWGGGFPPVERGIDFTHYSNFDPELDERSDPVTRWDYMRNSGVTQIEVWPLPATEGIKLWFEGLAPLGQLVQDTDTADLDDQLLVLSAAAEQLLRQKSADAQAVLAVANMRMADLKSSLVANAKPLVYGGGEMPDRRKYESIVRVGS
jgi:hypothetical protein